MTPSPKTKGTKIAEKTRARTNKLNQPQREKLRKEALKIIYSKGTK